MKRAYIGRVVSDKMDKTITVLVEETKSHPKYKKKYKVSKKYKAHDEKSIAKMGDVVKIIEVRPYSATKHCALVEVIEESID